MHDALDRLFPRSDAFAHRHIGPREADAKAMLELLGFDSMDALVDWSGAPARRPGRSWMNSSVGDPKGVQFLQGLE